ncbi:MAG: NYN domain-containing protein [Spirochaetales bacterium]|nr:NYN domain-containing protein [Spirochaetales bacterium]
MAACFLRNRMNNRSIIYIDGFNLYYGALKNTSYKWLNVEKLFSLLRQDDDIQKIKYFTALITGNHQDRQITYLQALKTCKKVEPIYGLFKLKSIVCQVRNCRYHGNKIFQVPEEKKTDVNIAVHIIDDAYNNLMDRIILVSGDSDLVPALRLVRKLFPHIKISVYIPANVPIRGAARQLRDLSHKHSILPNNLLRLSQFPEELTLSDGSVIHKPIDW